MIAGRNVIAWRPRVLDESVASVRIRCLNPLAELARRRFPVELYDPAHADRYGVVVYTKAYDEDSRTEAEALARSGTRIVFDLCDNHFFIEHADSKLVRKAENLERMLALADCVVASTSELGRVVREHVRGDKPVTIVEDAFETRLRAPLLPLGPRLKAGRRLKRLRRNLRKVEAEGRVPLVWFGVHGGPYARCGIADLERVRDVLHDLDRRHPISLTVISNSRARYTEVLGGWSIPSFYSEWHPATFFTAMREHEIAVIPITPSPFTRCKSHNRPAQALHLGLAVVADSIPSYEPLRGVTSLDDWERGLETYVSDAAARRRDVEAGRELVHDRWSLARVADNWQTLFESLLETARAWPETERAAAVAVGA